MTSLMCTMFTKLSLDNIYVKTHLGVIWGEVSTIRLKRFHSKNSMITRVTVIKDFHESGGVLRSIFFSMKLNDSTNCKGTSISFYPNSILFWFYPNFIRLKFPDKIRIKLVISSLSTVSIMDHQFLRQKFVK